MFHEKFENRAKETEDVSGMPIANPRRLSTDQVCFCLCCLQWSGGETRHLRPISTASSLQSGVMSAISYVFCDLLPHPSLTTCWWRKAANIKCQSIFRCTRSREGEKNAGLDFFLKNDKIRRRNDLTGKLCEVRRGRWSEKIQERTPNGSLQVIRDWNWPRMASAVPTFLG